MKRRPKPLWLRCLRAILVLGPIAVFYLTPRIGVDAQSFDLPGTQPATSSAPASAKIQHEFVPPMGPVPYAFPCQNCHTGGEARPLDPWQGSMMSQAARDPVFYAQLDLTNSDNGVRPEVAGMAEMCLRCHSPVGWLEGRSSDLTGMGFIDKDMFGVQCHACHRLVDPSLAVSSPGHMDVLNILNGLLPSLGIPPTFGNGMYVMDPKHTRRGPYSRTQMLSHSMEVVGDGLDWASVNTMMTTHPVFNSQFHRSGNLCGTCHDVSNPIDCLSGFTGRNTQKCFPIERTWSEWNNSAFPARGEAGSCQSCHMSGPLNGVGFGAPCEGGDDLGHLNDIHFHDLTGGNAFTPGVIMNLQTRYGAPGEANLTAAVNALYPPAGVNTFAAPNVSATALTDGVKRVQRNLRRAASLDVTGISATDITVRLTNRSGHKLPTGYPEGRRMWLNVKFIGSTGNLIAESGRYDPATGSLFHDQNLDGLAGSKTYDAVRYTNSAGTPLAIGRPTKVWEGRMNHLATGTEFHFALNNNIRMDNRIPPEGWNLAGFTDNRALPVIPPLYTANGWQTDYGAGGGPAVNFDEFSYPLPSGTDRVEFTLYYQTVSREYLEALQNDNPNTLTAGTFNRGTLLANAWQQTGRSTPVMMLHRVKAVVDSDGDGLSDGWENTFGLTASPQGGPNDDPDGDGLSNAQEFQLGSNPTDAASPNTGPARRPVDIVLVLDVSGSMNDPAPGTTTSKIQVLKDSVALFLETWKDYAIPSDRIGVIYFGTNADQYGAAPLLRPFFSELDAIKADVAGRAASGWTAMGAGLYQAVQGFGAYDPMSPRNRHIVLFSNGMQNRSPMVVPDLDFPDFLVMRNQTPAENSDVTGGSNVTIPVPGSLGFPLAVGSLIRVHTVGIGVSENSGGTSWHQLLKNLADQQQGKHNFITRAAELEGVFLEDLVETLRGNTLEYVTKDERTVPDGGEQVFEIPVNRSATKFSIVVSWSGQTAPAPALELIRPDGRTENIAPLLRGGTFYRIITRFLGNFDEDQGQYGTWKLRLRTGRAGQADQQPRAQVKPGEGLRVRVHSVLFDTDVKYRFTVPAGQFRIGEPLRVTATATQGSEVLKRMHGVTVTLTTPGASVGAELARSRRDLTNAAALDPDLTATPFSRRLLASFSDAGWRKRFAGVQSGFTLLDDGANGDERAGDGTFSKTLTTPSVPGHYELHFKMVGHTTDGQTFTREETHSLVVQIGKIDPGRSTIRRIQTGGKDYVILQPKDGRGSLLGPGYTTQILIRTGTQMLPVKDLLDGRYRAPLPAGFDPNQRIRISLGGQVFHNAAVPAQSFWEKFSWWHWLLLLLLIVLVIFLLRRL